MAIFDEKAKTYDDWYATAAGRLADAIEKELVLAVAAPAPGERALDAGCGTGNYTYLLAGLGLRVTGLDVSAGMLSRARSKCAGTKAPGRDCPEFVAGDFHALPFAAGIFDLVLSVTALEFSPQPGLVLQEARRVTRPGGRVVLAVLAAGSPWAELYEEAARQDPAGVFAHARFFTPADLRALDADHPPDRLVAGLYITPAEAAALPAEKAWAVERAARARAGGRRAGFLLARWPV